MKINIIFSIIFLFNLLVYGQTIDQRKDIQKSINKIELDKFKAKKQAKFEKDEQDVTIYLKNNPKKKRSISFNGKLYYIKSIDNNGKPIFITTKK